MRWLFIAIIAALSIAFLLVAFTGVVRFYRVPTQAMTPTIPVDSHVVAVRARNIARGDIVTFRYPLDPKTTFVKRVVAIGGDTVEIRAKKLILNGKEVHESYVVHNDPNVYPAGGFLPEPYRSRDHFGPLVIAVDHVFVLGDNRDASADSRYRGTVPRGNLTGRVVYVH